MAVRAGVPDRILAAELRDLDVVSAARRPDELGVPVGDPRSRAGTGADARPGADRFDHQPGTAVGREGSRKRLDHTEGVLTREIVAVVMAAREDEARPEVGVAVGCRLSPDGERDRVHGHGADAGEGRGHVRAWHPHLLQEREARAAKPRGKARVATATTRPSSARQTDRRPAALT